MKKIQYIVINGEIKIRAANYYYGTADMKIAGCEFEGGKKAS